MRPLVLEHKRRSWFIKSTWIMMILMTAFLYQCEKDTFEGETKGVCPEVISSDPDNGATNVVTNKIITATFNVAMEPSSVTAQTYTIKQEDTMVPGVVTYSGKIATFSPTNPLEANKTYTGMMSKKVKDYDGNYPIENYVWSFMTGNVPTVISTNPEAAASSVPLNQIITVTFSTDMDPSTINETTFLVNQGNDPIDGTVSLSGKKTTLTLKSSSSELVNEETKLIAGTVSYSEKTATFTPTSPLADNTVYSGTITMGAKDVAGNAMAGNYKWCFSTAQTQYTITLLSLPVEGGSTSGGGLYNEDDEATVVAIPLTGYTFTNWTEEENVVSTNETYVLPVTSNRTLVANFSINTYSLNTSAINGSVTRVPNQTSFDYGTSVLLTAVPNAGYSFTGWSGDAAGTSNSTTIIMDSDKDVTANFEVIPPNTFTLDVTSTFGGSTAKNPNRAGYTDGTVVQVTATPNTGYSFAGWSGDATGTANPLSITMNSDKNLVANFTPDEIVTYSLNVIANNGIVLKNPSQANYDEGSTVQLTASPNEGYTFTGWSGDATGSNNPLTVTMNSNKDITANFELIPADNYTLDVTAVNGSVNKNPNNPTYEDGETVELTATPDTGYEFSSWSGDAIGTDNPLNVLMDENKNITANFTEIQVDTYT
ncbi:MAG: Ig-like domain-containing protein, partial [Prolixibacteraceae bacterium]|nr:Ig-like domain-containing protein [Prolixibacteraceae bacterium]